MGKFGSRFRYFLGGLDMSRSTTGPGGALPMDLGASRVWIMTVNEDPTLVITPAQAPVIAVLSTDPGPAMTGAWYNRGTDPAGWRPLISGFVYNLPDNLTRLSQAKSALFVDEFLQTSVDRGRELPQQPDPAEFTTFFRYVDQGIQRGYQLQCGDPAAVVDGETLVIRWRDNPTNPASEVVYTFAMDRTGTYTPGPGEIVVSLAAAADSTAFATAVYEAFRTHVALALGGKSRHYGPFALIYTWFTGQELNLSRWDMTGTAISNGRITLSAVGDNPASAIFALQPKITELLALANMGIQAKTTGDLISPNAIFAVTGMDCNVNIAAGFEINFIAKCNAAGLLRLMVNGDNFNPFLNAADVLVWGSAGVQHYTGINVLAGDNVTYPPQMAFATDDVVHVRVRCDIAKQEFGFNRRVINVIAKHTSAGATAPTVQTEANYVLDESVAAGQNIDSVGIQMDGGSFSSGAYYTFSRMPL